MKRCSGDKPLTMCQRGQGLKEGVLGPNDIHKSKPRVLIILVLGSSGSMKLIEAFVLTCGRGHHNPSRKAPNCGIHMRRLAGQV